MMRRSTSRPPHIPRDVARYKLAIALLALVATLVLAALVAPSVVNLQVVLPLLIPPLTLALSYYFERRRR